MVVNKAKNFKLEFSAGSVVFCENGERAYLLLHYVPEADTSQAGVVEMAKRHKFKDSWAFPKGLAEKGEALEVTAKREMREETGIENLEFLPGFKHKIHYFFRFEDTLISKDVVYFLVRVKTKDVRLSWEHAEYAWLPYAEALERLTSKTDRETLESAETFLKSS